MTKKENMKLWNDVCVTDVDDTKEVSFGRKFTAIDAHAQVRAATEQFGPVGEGWGWDVELIFMQNETIGAKVTMWQGDRKHTFCHFGQASLKLKGKDSNKDDPDALKKATTDGITKCLSYLGFNADVFLGKFDDNKYVQDAKNQIEAKKADAGKRDFSEFEDVEALYDALLGIVKTSKKDTYRDIYFSLSLGLKRFEAMQVKAPADSLDYVEIFKKDCAAHAKKIEFKG